MTRLLHAPTVAPATHRLDAPAATLDQATRDLLERTEREAYARGRDDGAAAAEAAIAAAADRVQAAVDRAAQAARDEVEATAAARADQVTTLARQLAEAVLGHELHSGGQALVERVLAAVDALDHGPFTVHVAPGDDDLLADAALPVDVTLTVDAGLQPGDARITGPWSGADLTLAAVLDTLAEDQP